MSKSSGNNCFKNQNIHNKTMFRKNLLNKNQTTKPKFDKKDINNNLMSWENFYHLHKGKKLQHSKESMKDKFGFHSSKNNPSVCAVKGPNDVQKAELMLQMQLHTNKWKVFNQCPESHPDYNKFWRMFWDKKSRELLEKGVDLKHFNFKSAWYDEWKEISKDLESDERKAIFRRYDEKSTKDFTSKPNSKDKYKRKSSSLDSSEDEIHVEKISKFSGISKEKSKMNVCSKSHRTRRYGKFTKSKEAITHKESSDYSDAESSSEETSSTSDSDSPSSKKTKNRKKQKKHESIKVSKGYVKQTENLVSCLEKIISIEDQLGSLGPHLNKLLSEASTLEKQRPGFSNPLLQKESVVNLLLTVKEKFTGQILTGILGKRKEKTTKCIVSCINEVLKSTPQSPPSKINIPHLAKATQGMSDTSIKKYIEGAIMERGYEKATDKITKDLVKKKKS